MDLKIAEGMKEQADNLRSILTVLEKHGHVKNLSGLEGVTLGPLSQNLVTFFTGDSGVYFVGDDAIRLEKIIANFGEELSPRQYDGMTGSELAILSRIKKGHGKIIMAGNIPYIHLFSSHWNDWLIVLYDSHTGVCVITHDEIF